MAAKASKTLNKVAKVLIELSFARGPSKSRMKSYFFFLTIVTFPEKNIHLVQSSPFVHAQSDKLTPTLSPSFTPQGSLLAIFAFNRKS